MSFQKRSLQMVFDKKLKFNFFETTWCHMGTQLFILSLHFENVMFIVPYVNPKLISIHFQKWNYVILPINQNVLVYGLLWKNKWSRDCLGKSEDSVTDWSFYGMWRRFRAIVLSGVSLCTGWKPQHTIKCENMASARLMWICTLCINCGSTMYFSHENQGTVKPE